jgi:hypothetical protein
LKETCHDPRAAAGTKEHGDALHKKSAKHEFLIKARSDQRINNSKNCKFEVSLHILELAEVAAKARPFGKIHGDENNCSQPNNDHEGAHPTRRPLQPDVGQSLAT